MSSRFPKPIRQELPAEFRGSPKHDQGQRTYSTADYPPGMVANLLEARPLIEELWELNFAARFEEAMRTAR